MDRLATLEKDGIVYKVYLDRAVLDQKVAYFGRRAARYSADTGRVGFTHLLGGIVVIEADGWNPAP